MTTTLETLIVFITCPCMDPPARVEDDALACRETLTFLRPLGVPNSCDACAAVFRAAYSRAARSSSPTKSSETFEDDD